MHQAPYQQAHGWYRRQEPGSIRLLGGKNAAKQHRDAQPQNAQQPGRLARARQAGVRRGAYHFYYFCRPVEEQITWFEEHVPVDASALPPALDMEWNPQSKTCRIRPPRDKILVDMQKFLDELDIEVCLLLLGSLSACDANEDNLLGAIDIESGILDDEVRFRVLLIDLVAVA